MKPIRKLLIANRGEIAVRIARTCRDMGIASVAVYSEADAHALHVSAADEAYLIGPAPAAESYLCGDKIVRVAVEAGCDAVHPGYGFLSENAAFGQAVIDAGLTWVGPSPEAIALMGSKIESKRLAERSGVPVVPGYFGDDQSDERLVDEAGKVGYPLLVKASAGGGGKGMRVVESAAGLREAIEGARREAIAAFGDGSLMLERYLTQPRHIEVQVLGDSHGTLIHLGERECSIQRRHQKVVEESPSPVVTEELRERITGAALALARAAGYSNAGTVEFIYQDGDFYFLEMNTRLQVEHPVTEMAIGIDLVEAQLRVASGEPLWLWQEEVRFVGHAIECRLYAEDPEHGFLPSTGTLRQFRGPIWSARLDTGVSEGDSISPYYDPMIAKLICSGPDRAAAILNMRQSLANLSVVGVRNNLGFLRWLMATPEFREGALSTRFIEEHYTPGAVPELPVEMLLGAACAYLFNSNATWAGEQDMWKCNPWRQARQALRINLLIANRRYDVELSSLAAASTSWSACVRYGDTTLFEGNVGLDNMGRQAPSDLSLGGEARAVKVTMPGSSGAVAVVVTELSEGIMVRYRERDYWVRLPAALSTDDLGTAVHLTDEDTLESPMPGKVSRIFVAEGDEVSEAAAVMIIEAMKMEFTIRAPHDGRVARIHFKEGDQVAVGTVLAEMEKG